MSKHTPGPWRVARQNPSPTTGEWMIAGAKPGYLAEVRDCGSGDVQANARLIAASPSLLAALIDCVEHMEHSTPQGKLAYENAKSEIIKATGGIL